MNGLISAEALAVKLGAPDLFILDVRSTANGGGRAAFEASHIAGAQHSDYATAGWRVSVNGAPGMMPDGAALSTLIGSIGLRPDHDLVIVPAGTGASDFAAAARVYWTLKSVGHRQLAILDGGMAGWRGPVESGAPALVQALLYPVTAVTLRCTATDVLAFVTGGGAALLDARSDSYFHGKEKAGEARAAGHIPGARNIDYVTAFDPATMKLRGRDDLAKLFGSVPQGTVVSYCNTGHTAALNWFALSEILGRSDVRLYDGSMTDWTQDPARPVAV